MSSDFRGKASFIIDHVLYSTENFGEHHASWRNSSQLALTKFKFSYVSECLAHRHDARIKYKLVRF